MQGKRRSFMNIPKDKTYPINSVQCNGCGGNGCQACNNRGWLIPKNHPNGRRCMNSVCNKPLHPTHVAVYCSNGCALNDA